MCSSDKTCTKPCYNILMWFRSLATAFIRWIFIKCSFLSPLHCIFYIIMLRTKCCILYFSSKFQNLYRLNIHHANCFPLKFSSQKSIKHKQNGEFFTQLRIQHDSLLTRVVAVGNGPVRQSAMYILKKNVFIAILC